jgi:hypothetical protein
LSGGVCGSTFSEAGTITEKYKITKTVITEVVIKVADTPHLYHIIPANELANKENILLNPAKKPIAVAVSFVSVILLIQAIDIPSVAAAYKPYIANRITYIVLLVVKPIPK